MTKFRLCGVAMCVMSALAVAAHLAAQEPAWNAAAIKECDRACMVGVLDGYMNAIFTLDPKAVPALAADVRMTENTGQMAFSVRGGQMHHVEAAPFVTIPYGLGNGWTPGSGR